MTSAIILWCQKWIVTESVSANWNFQMYRHKGPRLRPSLYTKYTTVLCDKWSLCNDIHAGTSWFYGCTLLPPVQWTTSTCQSVGCGTKQTEGAVVWWFMVWKVEGIQVQSGKKGDGMGWGCTPKPFGCNIWCRLGVFTRSLCTELIIPYSTHIIIIVIPCSLSLTFHITPLIIMYST